MRRLTSELNSHLALHEHRVVTWAKYGIIARSDVSVKRASDRIEYAGAGGHQR